MGKPKVEAWATLSDGQWRVSLFKGSPQEECDDSVCLVPADPSKESVYRAAVKWAKHCNEGHVVYHHDSLEQLRRAIERAERKKK